MSSKDGATKKPWQWSDPLCFLLPPRQLQPAYGLHCAYDLPFDHELGRLESKSPKNHLE